jgi:hypothetical protein
MEAEKMDLCHRQAGGAGQNRWYFNTIPAVCCFIATVKGAPLL